MKHYEVRYSNFGAPGVFWTQAPSKSLAMWNCRLHYPAARILKVTPVVVDK